MRMWATFGESGANGAARERNAGSVWDKAMLPQAPSEHKQKERPQAQLFTLLVGECGHRTNRLMLLEAIFHFASGRTVGLTRRGAEAD